MDFLMYAAFAYLVVGIGFLFVANRGLTEYPDEEPFTLSEVLYLIFGWPKIAYDNWIKKDKA